MLSRSLPSTAMVVPSSARAPLSPPRPVKRSNVGSIEPGKNLSSPSTQHRSPQQNDQAYLYWPFSWVLSMIVSFSFSVPLLDVSYQRPAYKKSIYVFTIPPIPPPKKILLFDVNKTYNQKKKKWSASCVYFLAYSDIPLVWFCSEAKQGAFTPFLEYVKVGYNKKRKMSWLGECRVK